MNIGDPIEEQCVRMWKAVFGHKRMSLEDARHEFWKQNPAFIAGWKSLAKRINRVTTVATLEHVEEPET